MTAKTVEAIVIGGSAGALDLLVGILPVLPKDFPIPVVVVLHVHRERPTQLAELLRGKCALPVSEAVDKEPLAAGVIYIAPSNYHLLIERTRSFSLSVDEPLHFSRPAIDVLFESAADAYGAGLVGVLLTGASEDGAQGLACIKQLGGTTVVQLPDSAVARTMPEAALRIMQHDFVLPPDEIAPFLARLDVGRPGSTKGP